MIGFALLCHAWLGCGTCCYPMVCYICYDFLCFATLCYALLRFAFNNCSILLFSASSFPMEICCDSFLCFATSSCPLLCIVMLSVAMLSLCFALPCCAWRCFAMLGFALQSQFVLPSYCVFHMLCYAILYHVILSFMLCEAMVSYGTLCCPMLCYFML